MLINGVKPLEINNNLVYTFDSAEVLSTAAASFIATRCQDYASIMEKVSLALSGGSTPTKIYQQFIHSPLLEAMPWSSLEFYFGDERYVAHDDEQSNYKMAMSSFLATAPISEQQVYAIPTYCDDAKVCADKYSEIMKSQLGQKLVLDFALLGMGDDGHTASLFPATEVLSETEKPAAAVYVEKFNSWRISMTYPMFNRAKTVCILVAGEAKAKVLAEVLNNPAAGYPIQGIRNPNGMIWLVDRAATTQLT